MDFNEYQKKAAETAEFGDDFPVDPLIYTTLGLAGEEGEVVEKVKKIIRNDRNNITEKKREELKLELGDVLWYLSQIAYQLDIPMSEVAQGNIDKLADRKKRGVIASEGDNR